MSKTPSKMLNKTMSKVTSKTPSKTSRKLRSNNQARWDEQSFHRVFIFANPNPLPNYATQNQTHAGDGAVHAL